MENYTTSHEIFKKKNFRKKPTAKCNRCEVRKINSIMCYENQRIMKHFPGEVVGGVDRAPVMHFVAANQRERERIAKNTMRNNIGRMHLQKMRGETLISSIGQKRIGWVNNEMGYLTGDPKAAKPKGTKKKKKDPVQGDLRFNA